MANANNINIETPELTTHFLAFAQGAVLFREGRNNFQVLNSSAAYIWCLLQEGMDSKDIARYLSEKFQIHPHDARLDVLSVINIFNQNKPLRLSLSHGFETNRQKTESGDTPWPKLNHSLQWDFQKCFSIQNHLFEFSCQDSALGKNFESLMGHFSTSQQQDPDTKLAVVNSYKNKKNWNIYLNDQSYAQEISREKVLPFLLALAFTRTCQSMKDKLLFHAGVVSKRNKAILFPAKSGSGKTTLIAALVKTGFTYFSDEIAAINTNSCQVSPFLFPMTIKPGSVEALRPFFPTLSAKPIHPRPDGKLVRYLTPSPESLPHADEERTIRAIIFPVYTETQNRLLPLSKEKTLQKLAQTGTSGRNLTYQDVKTLINIADQTPGYVLRYTRLEQVCETVHTLFARPSYPLPRLRDD